jgi:hypothetical protein
MPLVSWMENMDMPLMHVHNRAFLMSLILLQLVFAGCGSDTSDGAIREAEWTWMVYMAGDSDISGWAFGDLNEMEEIGSTRDVNIVVQVEFSNEYPTRLYTGTLRGRIVEDHDYLKIGSSLTDLGNVDMTDERTLSGFITWAATNYPAKHYTLVLWSHGLGWKMPTKGMIEDDTSAGSFTLMTLPDIADAVRESGVALDLIDFDSCLMGMYEVAYEFRALTSYLTFSEASFPAEGNPYFYIFNELTANPEMEARDLARFIPEACKQSLEWFTKSAISVSAIERLHAGVKELARKLIETMDDEKDHIRAAIELTTEYDDLGYKDLGDFLDQLKGLTKNQELLDSIGQVETALADLVIENEYSSLDPEDPINRSHGLSIYLPSSGKATLNELYEYSLLSCNQGGATTWEDFLLALVTVEGLTVKQGSSDVFFFGPQDNTRGLAKAMVKLPGREGRVP